MVSRANGRWRVRRRVNAVAGVAQHSLAGCAGLVGAPRPPRPAQLAGDLPAPAPCSASDQRRPRVAIIGQRRAWTLGLYFGLINAGYASLIAWLPPYYMQLGDSAQYSGSLLALLTVGQTAGALLLPALARQDDRRQLLLCALVLQLIGFCGFIWLPQRLRALGSRLRRRSGRCVSPVPGAGPRSCRTTDGGRPAGSLYAGYRIYYRRPVSLAFRPAA